MGVPSAVDEQVGAPAQLLDRAQAQPSQDLGELEPAAGEDDRRGLALNRRVEMVFEDPEGRTIEAESQENDLQIERR